MLIFKRLESKGEVLTARRAAKISDLNMVTKVLVLSRSTSQALLYR